MGEFEDCCNCGRPIPAERARNGSAAYCSTFCYKQASHAQQPTFKYSAKCETCGSLFAKVGRQVHCRRCIAKYTRSGGHYYYAPTAKRGTCAVCHEEFVAVSRTNVCRRPPCPSALMGRKAGHTKVTGTYKASGAIDKVTACKAVVCDVVDSYLEKLFARFPAVARDATRGIKKAILRGHCGESVSRQNVAGAVFYLAANGGALGNTKRSITWERIREVIGGNAITMLKYARRYK